MSKPAKKNILHSSQSNEWYTPPMFADIARATFDDEIHLDPASCIQANEFIGAKSYYTIHDDGLSQDWYAPTVWLNPPYARQVPKWLDKLTGHLDAGDVQHAMVLVNASTDVNWFQKYVWEGATAVAFLSKRVRFIDEQGNPSTRPTHGNALVLYSARDCPYTISRFVREMRARNLGYVVETADVYAP